MSTRGVVAWRALTWRTTVCLALLLTPHLPGAHAATVTFDFDCATLDWFGSCNPKTNWDNNSLPTAGDDVTIGATYAVQAGSGNGPLIDIKSLNAAGGFKIDFVDLSLQSASMIASLDSSSTVITSAVRSSDGPGLTMSGNSRCGSNTTLRGAPLSAIFRNAENLEVFGACRLEKATLVNDGQLTQKLTLVLDRDALVRNLSMWSLIGNNANAAKKFPDDPDVALFVNQGTLRNIQGSNTVGVIFVSDAPGRVEAAAGTLTFNRQAVFGGPISVAEGALVVSQALPKFRVAPATATATCA